MKGRSRGIARKLGTKRPDRGYAKGEARRLTRLIRAELQGKVRLR